MGKVHYKILSMAMTMLLLMSMYFVGRETAAYVAGTHISTGKMCVVLDAGHGGDDPGKVGINGAKEKDINLAITLLVKTYLEAADVKVILTRQEDVGLYESHTENKKVQDMKRRVEVFDSSGAMLAVSIHQNSYPEEYVHGAQVFYYTDSVEGKKLAQSLQNCLIQWADPENVRTVKANDSYYLLKKTAIPIVIAECGFLSNTKEAEKLCNETYQEQVAWAIHLGILQYINSK